MALQRFRIRKARRLYGAGEHHPAPELTLGGMIMLGSVNERHPTAK